MKVYHLLLLSIVLVKLIAISEATPLSYESKKAIVVSALKGGLTTISTYIAGYALFNDFTMPRLSEHQTAYSIFATIGVLSMGWWRYQYVPESYYDWAHRELEKIARDKLVMLVLSLRGTELIEQIKYLYVRDSFPLVSAFKHINYLLSRLESIDESLDHVLCSSLKDLHASCFEMQIFVQTIQSALENSLKLIKEQPQFINEFNAQTSLAMQQAQAAIAQATHSQATATWVHALKD